MQDLDENPMIPNQPPGFTKNECILDNSAFKTVCRLGLRQSTEGGIIDARVLQALQQKYGENPNNNIIR